jgi:hypothetical protein
VSDNVIRPEQWVQNGQHSLARPADAEMSVAGGGGPPHDPDMENRVAALEADMKEVRTALGDITSCPNNHMRSW